MTEWGEDDVTKLRAEGEPTPILRLRPEAKMWGAVVEDALRCMKTKRYRAAAVEWFTSSSEAIGSYRWVILQLGGDPDERQRSVIDNIDSGKMKARDRRR